MVRRTSILIYEIVAMLFVGLIALSGIAAYLLNRGPVPLDFMTPHLEAMLNQESRGFVVDIDRTVLVWAGWRDAIDIRATRVSVTAPNGDNLARVPELSLGLSLKALVRGRLAPTSLDAIGPRIRVVRRETGEFAFGFTDTGAEKPERGSQDAAAAEQDSGAVVRFLVDELLGEPDPTRTLGYLRRVSVLQGQVAFEDRVAGRYYRAPNAEVVLLRGDAGITGGAKLGLQYGDRRAGLSVELAVSRDQSYRAAATFQQVEPAAFAPSIPQLAALTVVKIPLSGEISIRGDRSGRVDEIGFDFVGGEGKLELQDLYREPLDVVSLRLTGAVTHDLNGVRLDRGVVGLGDSTIYAKGAVAPDAGGRLVSLEARLEQLPMSEVHRYWPAWTHPAAHNWVATNIPDGVVDEGTVAVALRVGGPEEKGEVSLDTLQGTFAFTGLGVHYKRPMTPVVGGNGTATFDRHGFDFTIDSGSLAEDIVLREGKVGIVDIDKKGEARLIVDAKAEGPLVTALRVLDEEPLRYGSKLGFDASKMDGSGTSDLHFELPLVRNITGDMLELDVASRLSGVVAPGPFDIAVTEGELDLNVTRKAMRVAGDVKLNGVPADLVWDENFQDTKKFRRRFVVEGRAGDAERLALGLPELSYWLQGPVDAVLDYRIRDKKPAKLTIRGNLAEALLKVEEADWRKEPGAAGTGVIEGTVPLKGGLVFDSFRVKTGDMDADLRMEFLPDLSKVDKVTIRKAVFRGNDVTGDITLRKKKGGYRFDMEVGRFDVRHFLTFDNGVDGQGQAEEEELPFYLKSTFVEAITAEGRSMHRGQFIGEWDGRHWTKLALTGELHEGAGINVSFTPDGKGDYDLSIESHDAGQALRTLDWWGEIQGGALHIKGRRKGLDGAITGTFRVLDFRWTESPAGLRLLQVITIVGLPSAAQEGVPFVGLEGTFSYHKGVLTLGEVEGWGPVGLSVVKGGWLDFNKGTLGLAGTVVPANTVQGTIGKIPLLGLLLGDGLIAANFEVSGPLEKPKIDEKPGTVFAPGVLRKLFRVTPKKEGEAVDPSDKPGAESPRVQE